MSIASPSPEVVANARANVARLGRTVADLAKGLGVTVAATPPDDLPGVATVVVVGEPKNGKSSLVNALVGQPGLSPVDYAVATATYIAIRHGSPGALVFPGDADDAVEIHLEELPAWTSIEGLAANPQAPSAPRPVEVSVPAQILEHVTLIDTPGVGGFDGTHDRATLAALADATALLFCADGTRPLTEPELRFLTEAAGNIAHVVFALTKTDQEPAWRTILADNRAAVVRRAPAFADAPWFPVAAPLAERSLDPALPVEAARALRARSGLDAVRDHLVDHVGARVQLLVAANTVKQIRADAQTVREAAVARVALLDDPSGETRQRLQDEQRELDRLASLEDSWRTDLDLALTALRSAELNAVDRLVRETTELGTQYAKRRDVSTEQLTAVVNERLSVEAGECLARIAVSTDQQVRAIVGKESDSAAFAAAMDRAGRSAEVVDLREGRELVAEGRLQPAQAMPVAMSATSGLVLANLLPWTAAIPGVGIGIGVAAAATTLLFARRQSRLNERVQWVQARLAEARTDLTTMIDQRINAAKTLAQQAVREWIRSRQSQLRTGIAELNAQMGRDRAAQQQAVKAARAVVDAVDTQLRTCDSYLDRLDGGRT